MIKTFEIDGKEFTADVYRPRRIYQVSDDYTEIVGRFLFIIGGEMSDGTKCWYRCDPDGEIIDYSRWYSVGRHAGHLVAFLEAVN